MRRMLMLPVTLAAMVAMLGSDLAQAAGPQGITTVRKNFGPTKTVTTTTISGGGGELVARYQVTIVQKKWLCFTSTETVTTYTATFTFSPLVDGEVVDFIGPTQNSIGSAVAAGGQATLSLSSKNGDQIPQIHEGDGFGIATAAGGVFLPGFYGAPLTTTTVTTCGR